MLKNNFWPPNDLTAKDMKHKNGLYFWFVIEVSNIYVWSWMKWGILRFYIFLSIPETFLFEYL